MLMNSLKITVNKPWIFSKIFKTNIKTKQKFANSFATTTKNKPAK